MERINSGSEELLFSFPHMGKLESLEMVGVEFETLPFESRT